MRIKRITSLLLALVTALSLLTGCAGQKQTPGRDEDGRIKISMYMWDRSMFKELSPWLEQQFPDISFTFVQSYNTMEYYKDLMARGETMPDIITCRRFSLNDAATLAEYLMEWSLLGESGGNPGLFVMPGTDIFLLVGRQPLSPEEATSLLLPYLPIQMFRSGHFFRCVMTNHGYILSQVRRNVYVLKQSMTL